jgi:O-antigen/teichoic acid export membrane protein
MIHEVKSRVTVGLVQLTIRHLVGLCLTLISVGLILTRLSAREYGHIVLGQGVWFFFLTIAAAGVDGYVIRCRDELSPLGIRRIYFASLVTSAILFGAWLLAITALYSGAEDGTLKIVQLLGIGYGIRAIGIIPGAVLESELNYAPAGLGEVVGQAVYVGLLYVLLRYGFGVQAVVVAHVASGLVATSIILVRARIRPAVPISGQEIWPAVQFGLRSQGSAWVWQSKDLMVPVVITWAAGPEFVGLLGMTNQVTQKLLFFRQIVWRVSVSAISRLKRSTKDMQDAVQYGADAQALVLGAVLLGIWAAFFVMESWTGGRWTGVSKVFPAVALGIYVNSAFSMGCSALFSLGRIGALTAFHAAYVVMFIGTLGLMHVTSPLHVYFAAELFSCLAYVYLLSAVRAHVGPFDIGYSATVGAIVLSCMFVGVGGRGVWLLAAAAVALAAVMMLPRSRFLLRAIVVGLRGAVSPEGA